MDRKISPKVVLIMQAVLGFIGLVGVIIVSVIYDFLGWFPVTLYLFIYLLLVGQTAMSMGIVANVKGYLNDKFSAGFPTNFKDEYEIYSQIENRLSKINEMYNEFQNGKHIVTKETMYKSMLIEQESYNELLRSVNDLDTQNARAFHRYNQLNKNFKFLNLKNPEFEEQVEKFKAEEKEKALEAERKKEQEAQELAEKEKQEKALRDAKEREEKEIARRKVAEQLQAAKQKHENNLLSAFEKRAKSKDVSNSTDLDLGK